MKLQYKPNPQIYKEYYCGHGHGLPVFRGVQYQQGYGIGNLLGGLIRKAMPLIANMGKTVGKTVGKELLRGGKDVLGDVIAGQNLKSSLRTRGKERAKSLSTRSIQHVKRAMYDNLRPQENSNVKRKKAQSRKRPAPNTKEPNRKKRKKVHKKHSDIFGK